MNTLFSKEIFKNPVFAPNTENYKQEKLCLQTCFSAII